MADMSSNRGWCAGQHARDEPNVLYVHGWQLAMLARLQTCLCKQDCSMQVGDTCIFAAAFVLNAGQSHLLQFGGLATPCACAGKYGTLTHVPIHHLDRCLTFRELCALYSITDVALVTSLRDGMNLVSYEFVACQAGNHGVLVLSEFAGAAQSLGAGSLLVNPWNVNDMSAAIRDVRPLSYVQPCHAPACCMRSTQQLSTCSCLAVR